MEPLALAKRYTIFRLGEQDIGTQTWILELLYYTKYDYASVCGCRNVQADNTDVRYKYHRLGLCLGKDICRQLPQIFILKAQDYFQHEGRAPRCFCCCGVSDVRAQGTSGWTQRQAMQEQAHGRIGMILSPMFDILLSSS
jgi:hypothetical protein